LPLSPLLPPRVVRSPPAPSPATPSTRWTASCRGCPTTSTPSCSPCTRYLRTPELHISIFIRQTTTTTIAIGLPSQHKAESETILKASHKVYIDRSLAFSRDNHVVDF